MNGVARRDPGGLAVDGALQTLGIPGHHAVCYQRQCAGGRDRFLRPPAASRW